MKNETASSDLLQKWIGKTIAERYRVTGVLGVGGMGAVFSAEQESLNRHVALKLIHSHLANTSEAKLRFKQEAQVVAQINHPNVIQVYDFGETKSGELYIVSELLEGKDFSDLTSSGRVTWQDALFLMRDVAAGLHAAHQKGIIHRDLKPDNLMYFFSGENNLSVKILDFGIAKLCGEKNSQLTGTGMVLGTPGYMPPEQILGEIVDFRGDLYSVGLVFLELLAGKKIYTGAVSSAILVAQVTDEPPKLKDLVTGVTFPDEIQPILDKLLDRDLKNRFECTSNFLEKIVEVIQKYQLKPPQNRLNSLSLAGEGEVNSPLDSGQFTEAYQAFTPLGNNLNQSLEGKEGGTETFSLMSQPKGNATPPSAEHLQIQLSQQQKIVELQDQLLNQKSSLMAGISTPSAANSIIQDEKKSNNYLYPVIVLLVLAFAGLFFVNRRSAKDENQSKITMLAEEIERLKTLKNKPSSEITQKDQQQIETLSVKEEELLKEQEEGLERAKGQKPSTSKSRKKKKLSKKSVKKSSKEKLTQGDEVEVKEVEVKEVEDPATENTLLPKEKEQPKGIVIPTLNSKLLEDSLFKSLGIASKCNNTIITVYPQKQHGLAVQHCPSYKEIDPNQWVKFEINEAGFVEKVRLKNKDASSSRIGKCIIASIKKWRFEAFENKGKSASLSMPVYFKTCLPINGECIFAPPKRI